MYPNLGIYSIINFALCFTSKSYKCFNMCSTKFKRIVCMFLVCMCGKGFAHGALSLLADLKWSLRMTFGYRYLQLPCHIIPLLMICILHQSAYSSKFHSLFSAVKYPVHNIVFMYHEQNVTCSTYKKHCIYFFPGTHMYLENVPC